MAGLRIPLLITLFITFALSLASFALEIHSLVQSKDDKKKLKKVAASQGAKIEIDTDDVLDPGYVLTAALGLTFVSCLGFLALNVRKAPSLLQPLLLSFCAAWVFSTLVPFTLFVATHRAKLSGTLAGIPIPQQLFDLIEKQLGVTSVYKDIDYLRQAVIVPWVAFPFILISIVLSFLERRRAQREVRDEPKY
jgi:preprotein translocase subunit SecG